MILQVIFSILFSILIFFMAFTLDVGEIGWGSNFNALLIVLGGTVSATLIAYPWRKLAWTAELLKRAFLAKEETSEVIGTVVGLARTYRQGGIRALEKEGDDLPPGILKTAVELIAQKKFGHMVSWQPPDIVSVPIENAIDKLRLVEPEGELVKMAEGIGVSFGR